MSEVYDKEDNDSCSTETNLLLDYKWWEDKPFQTTLKETKNEKEKVQVNKLVLSQVKRKKARHSQQVVSLNRKNFIMT